MPATDTDQTVQLLADAICAYISAADHRTRFEEFADAVGDRNKLVTLLRSIETTRLLEGGDGPVIEIDHVETVCATGAKPSDARDLLFFGVTSALSSNGVSLAA